MDPTDEDLARRARHGDGRAVEEIWRRYAGRLWREVVRPLLRDDARAEDALCEAFASALAALPRFEAREGGLWPWLRQIGRRKALDEIRRARRADRAAPPAADDAAPDAQADLLDREREGALAGRVALVLAALNPRYAQALRLRLQEGRSRDECAALLGVKVGTFDVVLHRAVTAFRAAYLERYGRAPEEEA